MAYLERTDIEAYVPAPQLLRALCDDGSGNETAGLFDNLATQASRQVDALISTRYDTPVTFDPLPQLVVQAAAAFFLCSLFQRNGIPDMQNPWSAQANDFRQQLKKVGRGEIPLQSNAPAATLKAGHFGFRNADGTAGGDLQYREVLGGGGYGSQYGNGYH